AVSAASPSVGESLLHAVLGSQGNATGDNAGDDWLLLDDDAPQLMGASASDIADRWIFSGNRNLVKDVHVAGERVVADARHRDRDAIAARYRQAIDTLLE